LLRRERGVAKKINKIKKKNIKKSFLKMGLIPLRSSTGEKRCVAKQKAFFLCVAQILTGAKPFKIRRRARPSSLGSVALLRGKN
jgi:hypothetical protein